MASDTLSTGELETHIPGFSQFDCFAVIWLHPADQLKPKGWPGVPGS